MKDHKKHGEHEVRIWEMMKFQDAKQKWVLLCFCMVFPTMMMSLHSFSENYLQVPSESKAVNRTGGMLGNIQDASNESNKEDKLSERRSHKIQSGIKKGEEYHLAVVVPGLGDATRISTLNQSLQLIMASDKTKTSCIVYVYNQTLLDKNRHDLPQCDLEFNEGYWTKHMQRAPIHPVVNGRNATHVALLMDDIALGANTSVDDILQTMKEANYQAVSPAFPDWYHVVMRPRDLCRTHLTNFIDVLFVVMTIDAWKCWKTNVDRYIRFKHGWGLDIIFADSCNISSGIIDDIPATHMASNRSYATHDAHRGMYELLKSHLGNGTTKEQVEKYKTDVQYARPIQYPYCDLCPLNEMHVSVSLNQSQTLENGSNVDSTSSCAPAVGGDNDAVVAEVRTRVSQLFDEGQRQYGYYRKKKIKPAASLKRRS